MTRTDLSAARWRKSTHSGEAGSCVEIAYMSDATAIRDSKIPDGGALVLDARAWSGLLSAVKSGNLDLP